MRVLDSFGTDAEFNFKRYKEEIRGGRSPWGDLDLHLAQFMTMYREYQVILEIFIFLSHQNNGKYHKGAMRTQRKHI